MTTTKANPALLLASWMGDLQPALDSSDYVSRPTVCKTFPLMTQRENVLGLWAIRCLNYPTLPLLRESSHRPCVTGEPGCASKTLFTKAGGRSAGCSQQTPGLDSPALATQLLSCSLGSRELKKQQFMFVTNQIPWERGTMSWCLCQDPSASRGYKRWPRLHCRSQSFPLTGSGGSVSTAAHLEESLRTHTPTQ